MQICFKQEKIKVLTNILEFGNIYDSTVSPKSRKLLQVPDEKLLLPALIGNAELLYKLKIKKMKFNNIDF